MLKYSHPAAVFAAGVLALATWASAATIPYNNDFSSSASDFTLSTAGNGWTLDTANSVLKHEYNQAATWTAAAAFTDLGGSADAAADFILKADFSATAANGTGSWTGVQVLGNSSFSTGYRIALVSAVSPGNNGVSISRNGTGVASGGASRQLRYLLNVAMEFQVTATYIDTNSDTLNDALRLDVILIKISDGAVLADFSYTDYAPLTGTYFGFNDKNANGSTPTNIYWDSFTIVPEPASCLMLAASAGLLMVRRRNGC